MGNTNIRGDNLTGAGWLTAGNLSETANGYLAGAVEEAKNGIETLKNAPTNPAATIEKLISKGELPSTRLDDVLGQALQKTQSANPEIASAGQEYLNGYWGSKAAEASAKSSFSASAKMAGAGFLAYEGAMAVKNTVVVAGYANEEQNGTMGTPDTNGKALVRDFTTAINNAKKTGKVSEQDLFNMYGSAVTSQIFGAETAIDPDSHSPIATADVAGRYGEDIKQRTYEGNRTEEKELQNSKAERRAGRERAKDIRSTTLNIPSIQEQKTYMREY